MEALHIYTPNYKNKINVFKSTLIMLKNIYLSKELILVLFRRDFFAIYKKSFLGVAWVLISPIIGIVSWVFMNQTGILNPGDIGIPYPAFVLLSSSIWGLFMAFYGASASTLGAGTEFILQVKYPHESLLFKQILLNFTNFLIGFLLNILVLLAFGVTPSAYILLLPILILPMFFFAASLGLVISMISIVSSDITGIFNIIFNFTFYLTPIIYISNTKSQLLQNVNKYNPLTYLVGNVRDLILFGKMDNLEIFLSLGFVSFLLFIISWRLFFVSEDRLIEKMI